jgi:hypothetical protein
MDARRALAALGLLMHLPDPPGELSVLLLAAGRPGPVRIEAARETFSSAHARLTLRLPALSASMNG